MFISGAMISLVGLKRKPFFVGRDLSLALWPDQRAHKSKHKGIFLDSVMST